jgi:putative endonuclease
MFYVYVLHSEKDGLLYTGATRDLKARFHEHENGRVASTRHRLPVRLVYYEASLSQADAFQREKYLKSGPGKRYLRSRLKEYLASLTG